jgi:hypothetical protein
MSSTLPDKKNLHRKKMISVIIITAVIIAYFILYFGFLVVLIDSAVLKWILGIIPAVLGAVMIGLCVQRIKEIKGGEEDDLSEY